MTQGLDASGSVVRRWQLAAALKAQREQAGLTQEQAIERLVTGSGRWSRSKLSRVENREHQVKPREVEQLLDAYGVTDPVTRGALVQLSEVAREQVWWLSFGKEFPDQLRPLLSLESGLVGLRDFQNQLVHGLLQSADYTRALAMSINPGLLDPAELERRVAARMARQQILTRDDPPQMHFILDETILQRLIGDRIVMHDQTRKLLHSTEKPNITIQILPRDVGGSPGLEGPFSILTLPDPIPDIGYTEGAAGTFYVEDRDRVRDWVLRFGILTQRAWSREKSAEVIAEAMKNYK
ncbi:MAG: helix-turn-helix domain-containing protein [Actinomycetota bacterium]|nr:helix-turn-helix domain-containing protein [Actinomycetota bacterium]